jgi:hypothetical protein
MTRGTVVTILAAVLVVAIAVVMGRAPEQPTGPASSSYATTPGGIAAYATLLERAGHDVRRVRAPLDDPHPSGDETIVIVDGSQLPGDERRALRAYVRGGGHAILAGTARSALGVDAGRPRPQDASRPVTRRIGRGAVTFTDADPLRNRNLATGDRAAAALMLAGPPARRVAFVESVHGYHEQRGLSALPGRVQTCLWLLGLAALAFLLVRGRRLGPPEDEERALAPARRAHVEALAAALARTRDRTTLLDPTPTTTETPPT